MPEQHVIMTQNDVTTCYNDTKWCYWVENGDILGKRFKNDGFSLSSNQILSSNMVRFVVQIPKQMSKS